MSIHATVSAPQQAGMKGTHMGIDDNAQHPEREEESESFADLFEAYTSGMKEDLQVGDRIQGEIIAIGKDSAFVSTGTKIDGVVDLD